MISEFIVKKDIYIPGGIKFVELKTNIMVLMEPLKNGFLNAFAGTSVLMFLTTYSIISLTKWKYFASEMSKVISSLNLLL